MIEEYMVVGIWPLSRGQSVDEVICLDFPGLPRQVRRPPFVDDLKGMIGAKFIKENELKVVKLVGPMMGHEVAKSLEI